MKQNLPRILLYSISLLALSDVLAGKPDILHVQVYCTETYICEFTVTLVHTDEGWDHYADRWEILRLDGEVLATRTLLHPHVHEQPFTRSLGGISIPEGVDKVIVRAHDSVHGYGVKEIQVALPPHSADRFNEGE